MNFLRLPDPLLSVLFENEDIFAIDKPYGFNAHTNDSKIEHSDMIQDGLIEMYEKQLNQKLHIVHRLDQTTTGVMIFGKSVESAKKYAEFFFNRQVKKTYWFITKKKSAKNHFLIDQVIIHKGRELEAKTELSLLNKKNGFELWEAHPFTGRNHQIRIHALAANISILGDPKYGGDEFPFLCLHDHKIEFPNGIAITAQPPVYYNNLEILEDRVLAKTFFESDRRLRFFGQNHSSEQCFRLVHNLNNSKDPGFTIDQFGEQLVLTWSKDYWSTAEQEKFSFFSKTFKKQILFRGATEKKNATQSWIAHEKNIKFELRNEENSSVGLFLSQRLHRNWVSGHSLNKSVLNLFSYTGGFGLAAAIGGAKEIISVESSKNALAWSRKNFELNHIDTGQHKFLCRDSLSFLEQLGNKGSKFDLVICNAPTFFRRDRGVFKIETDLDAILKSCFICLNLGGELLFLTQSDKIFIDDIRKAILKVQKDLKIKNFEINCILPSLDFELPNEKPNLKSFIIRILED